MSLNYMKAYISMFFPFNPLTPVVSKSYLVFHKLMGIYMGDLILGVIL